LFVTQHQDGIASVIEHFVGYFAVRTQDARMWQAYDEFRKDGVEAPDQSDIAARSYPFHHELAIDGYEGEAPHAPHAPTGGSEGVPSSIDVGRIEIDIPPLDLGTSNSQVPAIDAPALIVALRGIAEAPGEVVRPIEGPVQGSTILAASQMGVTFDNDVVVLGDPGFPVAPHAIDGAALAGLVAQAHAISAPLTQLQELGAPNDIAAFFNAAASVVRSAETDAHTTAFRGTDLDGRFLDGERVDALPEIDTDLAAAISPPPAAPQYDSAEGRIEIDPSSMAVSVSASSGGNIAFNEATVLSAGLTTAVIAVAGDYHRIDTIVQTNIYSDIDTLDAAWPGAGGAVSGTTVARNGANFSHEELAATASSAPELHPQNWRISVVDGDMVFVNWVKQYSFTSDYDTLVLTATGTTTTVTTGGNVTFDNASFATLGRTYDLIMVGGNLYDGNFIIQTNVLFDDDRLEMIDSPAGASGTLSTSGNLLWNEASIHNVGAVDWKAGLPAHYEQAMAAIASGNSAMPSAFSTDASFAGTGMLNVLYVSGSIYDLNYIEQTNIVGDADYVAIYEQQLQAEAPEGIWTISTGGNVLVNSATIVDFDSVGSAAHVGGQVYSAAMLVQAEIIESVTVARSAVDGLATEAIAFLGDDDESPAEIAASAYLDHLSDGYSGDIMQSVLA
jgi:hypothetical protein